MIIQYTYIYLSRYYADITGNGILNVSKIVEMIV